jgi:hypothetical protein
MRKTATPKAKKLTPEEMKTLALKLKDEQK